MPNAKRAEEDRKKQLTEEPFLIDKTNFFISLIVVRKFFHLFFCTLVFLFQKLAIDSIFSFIIFDN